MTSCVQHTPAEILRAHQRLPRFIRIQYLVPATAVLVAVLGFGFTLPSGPLCDEGMVLFMEGGCDYGESNVFFHSKLGVMLALTAAFAIAWRGRVQGFSGFVPHLAVAGVLALANRSGGGCDTYYSHPNGSIGQMVVEVAAWAILGIAALGRWSGGSGRALVGVTLVWWMAYVASFYAWLLGFSHWTWAHTWAISGTLALVAAGCRPTTQTDKGRSR